MNAQESSQHVLSTTDDRLYKSDSKARSNVSRSAPWVKNVLYFKHVKISTLALLKMTNHAQAGGQFEVMGVLQGKLEENTFVIMDAYATPVEGTETRVNAHADGYEYICNYHELSGYCGFEENVVGWYHSHPGYGCWLSGIDVDTQMNHQVYCDPYVAIVIDHQRTAASGKVEIGAFRTYPDNYKPLKVDSQLYQSVPLDKIKDYGVHSNRYYRLDVSFFCSSISNGILDILWSKNWASTFASCDSASNQQYVSSRLNDLTAKIKDIMANQGQTDMAKGKAVADDSKKSNTTKTIRQDLCRFAGETVNVLIADQLKRDVFTTLGGAKHIAFASSEGEEPLGD